MKQLRLAFLGFRHGHVMGLYKSAREHPYVQVVAAAEEHEATAETLRSSGAVKLTHSRYSDVYRDVDFDAVAIGDYFGRRGELIVQALQAGKHVIADKPICTRLSEFQQISELVQQKQRSLGCLLDLRDHGPFITMRRLVREGAIGTVHTINFTAQHPLLPDKRPAWYFEDGKHGGTINDIAVHAIDLIPWLTNRTIAEVVAARAWNARLAKFPSFQDAAQIMLRLDNAGGVMGDLSYLSPDGIGYSPEQYWRVLCHGDGGAIETSYNAKAVWLARTSDTTPQSIPADPGRPTGCLTAFLTAIDGTHLRGALTTADVLDATRRTLLIQRAADEHLTHVSLD
jgi:predicted dehydrogenase